MPVPSSALFRIFALPLASNSSQASISVEELAWTILERENLPADELVRCRYEVLLQLAFSPPYGDTAVDCPTDGESDFVGN